MEKNAGFAEKDIVFYSFTDYNTPEVRKGKQKIPYARGISADGRTGRKYGPEH